MLFWNLNPFVRLIIPFIIGIIAGLTGGFYGTFLLIVLLLAFGLMLMLVLFGKQLITFKTQWIYGIIINVFLVAAGYIIVHEKNEYNSPDHFGHTIHEAEFLLAEIIEPVTEKEKSIKVVARIPMLRDSIRWKKTSGKMMIYLQKDSNARQLRYGDYILLNGKANTISPPKNPAEFNYKRYLQYRNIFHQGYYKSEQWMVAGHKSGNRLYESITELRAGVLKILREHGIEGKEFAVASAMLLGYDEKLDPATLKQYSGAGAMHILCVSGLHVGIVFLILNSMLQFLGKYRYGKPVRTIILLVSVWFYAMLTGLSPSVSRASTMMSFVIIGLALNRHTSIYNSLAVSAFILLLINPYLIANVGFQLSYMAVISIVAMQPAIYRWWTPNGWLLKKIWAISAVSIAAQLGTAPLAILYFHQFPNYFLLTNLIVIPLSSFIIYSGVALVIISWVPLISDLAALILTKLIQFMNVSIQLIEGFSFSTTSELSNTWVQTIFLYLALISISVFFIEKRKFYAWSFLVALLLFFGGNVLIKHRHHSQDQIVVYHVNGSTAIDLITDGKNFLIADSNLVNNSGKIDFHIRNHWVSKKLKERKILSLYSNERMTAGSFYRNKNFITCNGQKIYIADGKIDKLPDNFSFKINYLVVTGGYENKIEPLARLFEPDYLIIDSSVPYWKTPDFYSECESLGLAYHDVRKQGAFIDPL